MIASQRYLKLGDRVYPESLQFKAERGSGGLAGVLPHLCLADGGVDLHDSRKTARSRRRISVSLFCGQRCYFRQVINHPRSRTCDRMAINGGWAALTCALTQRT